MKYYFDEEAADRAVNFIEKFCTHVKGELSGFLAGRVKIQAIESTGLAT